MRLAAKHVLLVPAHITAALHGLPVHLRARAAPALPPGVPALAPVVTSDARDLDTCMSLLSRKLLSLPRAPINARVVVVGASDTGLSTLELLLAHPDVYFTSLTLVSPDGLPYLADEVTPCLPWSLAHDPARVRRSGLASRVRVVEEAVVAVDTERDVVRLGSGALLAFDCLVIATGLVDGTAAAVGADAWKLERERDTARMARALGLDLLTVGTAPANNEADKDDEPAPDANADTNADADAEAGPDADSALVAPRGPVAGLVTVRTERDADQLLRLVRARPPACAVVYGCTLRAVVLLGALLDAGVPGDALVWAHPQPADAAAWAAGDEVVADTVRAALRGRGVTILPLTRLDAVRCTREGALARLICTNLDADAQFAVDCGLCLCAADVDADPHMLAALAAVSAAYDGRLLVDRGLRVCGIDKGNVLAAGSLCKFARKLNACAPLADYSPPALGACLARAVVECVDALQAESAPRLDAVRVLGAPGGAEAGRVCGLQYLRVRQEPAEGAPDPEQCQVLTSRMDGRYCKLVFGGRNHALVELVLLAETGPGHQELPLTTLARLVGLPAVFLPAVFACEGDLVAALWSPKTLALAHDALPALRQAAAAALANPGPSGDESAVARLVEAMGEVSGPERVEVARKLAQELDEDKKRAVRASVWEFVVANADHLPGYAVPAVKQ
jgi:NADH dehydrogenase FAD-containing subunit